MEFIFLKQTVISGFDVHPSTAPCAGCYVIGRSTEGGGTVAQQWDGTSIGCNVWDAKFLPSTCCKKWSRTPGSSTRLG